MRTLFRTSLMASAMSIALSGAALAQAAYSGTYVGVSGTVNNSHCEAAQTPGPLTIANGAVSSATGFFTGTVDANGHVVMHTKGSSRFEGNIDAAGNLTAGGGPPSCAYTFVWKKR
ncbi:MAG TPA: hypothetical protein VLX67_03990 [Stellaceae bacterium]|nr:hypothetical protein [Stellaceae bacterium]